MLSGSVNRSAFLERAELEGSLTGELTRADNLIKCDWQAVSEPIGLPREVLLPLM